MAPTHRGRGIGRRLLDVLPARGRTLRCVEARVLTDDRDSTAAHSLYGSTGGVPTPECSATMYTFPLDPAPRGWTR